MSSKWRFAGILVLICCEASAGEWRTETVADLDVHLYERALPRALLIALHGCTQSHDALRDRGNFEGAADLHEALIALPQVPDGGVIAGCWDYYGSDHSLDNRHNRYLIALVDALVSQHAIDPDRVYLIGLSSGAGEAFVIGCLAPDRFAGIGIVAGPAVGTDVSQFGSVSTDRDTAASVCRTLAGDRTGGFAAQLTSVIQGADDFVVARGYTRLNAEIMASIYGAASESVLDVSSLPGTSPAGEGAIWSDAIGPRVSSILVDGMGHAFPAGEGDGLETNFVAQEGVAYPAYVLAFFEQNNRRTGTPPIMDAGVKDSSAGAQDASDPVISKDPEPPATGCSCRTGG